MKIQDVMTRNLLTIRPEASIKDAAAMLVENGISGVPVCDGEGTLVGVLSEGDILYKEHDPREGERGPLAWLVDGSDRSTVWKARALTVRDAMSTPPVTISPYRTVADAARLMSDHGVNRLPVVKGDELVGIVTRADLVRAFVRTDEEIEREIREDVLVRTLWLEAGAIQVQVDGGAVALAGAVQARSDAKLLERLVGRVPGVIAVTSHVTWDVDDSRRRTTLHA